MTITTTAPAQIDVDLITALDASPDFTVVNNPGHLAELLGIQTPNTAALAVLNDTALASGRERGIVAAGILERITPDDVLMEEANLGTDRKVRALFLYQDGPDAPEQIALHFFDRTASIWVHIDSADEDEQYDGLMSPERMFDVIRAYYRV